MRRLNRTLTRALNAARGGVSGAQGVLGVGAVTFGVWHEAGIGWAAILLGGFLLFATAMDRR